MTREELYEKVWSAPFTKVAKDLDISYPKLKNICQIWNIPIPGNSYWGYLRNGTAVEPQPLPPYEGEELDYEELRKYRRTKHKDRPVMAISILDGSETYFSSITEAQRRLHSAYQSIYNAAHSGHKHKNFFWRWAEKDEKPKEATQIKEDLATRFDKTLQELHSLFYMMMARENEERKS